MAEELKAFFVQAFKESMTIPDLSYGDHLWGSRRLMDALAGFYNACVPHSAQLAPTCLAELSPLVVYSKFKSSTVLKPSDIITGNGCSALLDQLFHVLLDAGEGALLSTPYYSGFDRDLKPRSGTVLVGVPLEEEGEQEGDIERRFGRALRESEDKCVKVRSLPAL